MAWEPYDFEPRHDWGGGVTIQKNFHYRDYRQPLMLPPLAYKPPFGVAHLAPKRRPQTLARLALGRTHGRIGLVGARF